MNPQGIYFHQNRTWMCLPDLEKFDFLFPIFKNFFTQPPISIPSLIERHPILPKLSAFYNNLLKVHQIYVILATQSLMKTHWWLYQISWKKAPQKADTCTNSMSMWETPGMNYK